MKLPTKPWTLLYQIYRQVLPQVRTELAAWEKIATQIPDEELRNQALASLKDKRFHCEGGAVYGLLARNKQKDIIRFIVAYQTISDYLDNLCDRSTSLSEQDFRRLHESLLHALDPEVEPGNYYAFREEQEDGYLCSLVTTCQEVLRNCPGFLNAQPYMQQLAGYYCDLQVYKHVAEDKREALLESWFARVEQEVPQMSWYEFSACAGSTLGVFCLAAYAAEDGRSGTDFEQVKEGYFPWLQGLHIMLDYFIDQEEDRIEGDLNFVSYYQSEEEMTERMRYIKEQADRHVLALPDASFHRMINKGLLAIYLADEKVQADPKVKRQARQFIRFGGMPTVFFYMNMWMYRGA
ncbi:tetraprenyl-beta-curcumene synthase family protein [Salsuginibacillus kocurii]|uniref:tetraprenyl-beta-curcumene synthase family protein n=1 Tax=Salsuginibacillus kocurii TaxID=427078 RepID=UPI000360386A|nr:tetraprenyl-beta-curcumene synthase family protein [Salsuginibacillus kocurii]